MRTVNVTINGETRPVEVEEIKREGHRSSFRSRRHVALFSKGRGGKLWSGTLVFREEVDGSLTALFHGTFLNRAGYRAIRWNDQQFAQYLSQHNSAGGGTAPEALRVEEAVNYDCRTGDVIRVKCLTGEVRTLRVTDTFPDFVEAVEAHTGKMRTSIPYDRLKALGAVYVEKDAKRAAGIDAALGAERLDDATAARLGVRLYDATYKGRLVKVTVPENDGA